MVSTMTSSELPNGWMEREPEQLEDRLFISNETCEKYDGVAKRHVAVYPDGVVECYNGGDYQFHQFDDKADQMAKAREWMEAHTGGE